MIGGGSTARGAGGKVVVGTGGMCLPEERVEEEEGRLGRVDVGATDGPERHRGDNVTYHHKNRDRAYSSNRIYSG